MGRVKMAWCVGAVMAAVGLAVPLMVSGETTTRTRPITGPVKLPPVPPINPVPLYLRVDPAALSVAQQKAILKIDVETRAAIRKLLVEEHKKVVAELTDKQKAALAEADLKDNLDSMSEMGEMESMRLQMAMDRMSKFMQALSNILKKTSDTDSNIIQNLK